jgi:hypothetical protein
MDPSLVLWGVFRAAKTSLPQGFPKRVLDATLRYKEYSGFKNEYNNLFNLVGPPQSKSWFNWSSNNSSQSADIPEQPSQEFRVMFDNIKIRNPYIMEFERVYTQEINNQLNRSGGKRRRKTRGKSRRSKTKRRRRS